MEAFEYRFEIFVASYSDQSSVYPNFCLEKSNIYTHLLSITFVLIMNIKTNMNFKVFKAEFKVRALVAPPYCLQNMF